MKRIGTALVIALLAQPAIACPATKSVFVREADGARFAVERYGETPQGKKRIHYSVFAGRLNGKRAFMAMGLGPTGTGWSESTWRDEYTRLGVRWGKAPPTAKTVFFPAHGTGGPLDGEWKLAECRE